MTYTAAAASTDLETALDYVIGTLEAHSESNWSSQAGSLDWNCRQTAEHVGQVFAHYASQVAIHARTRYVRWAARVQQPDAPVEGVLDFVEATGCILALVVRASADTDRIFHPYGIADPAGFAAGAGVELLVHGDDIASGLGVAFEPPEDVCEHLVARLFPHHSSDFADSWLAIRWATGRVDLPDLPRLTKWKWRATPLSEEWVSTEAEPARFTYVPRK